MFSAWVHSQRGSAGGCSDKRRGSSVAESSVKNLQPEQEGKPPQEDQGLSPTFKAHRPGSHGCSGWESSQKYKLHKYSILEEEEYEAERGPGCGRGSNHG